MNKEKRMKPWAKTLIIVGAVLLVLVLAVTITLKSLAAGDDSDTGLFHVLDHAVGSYLLPDHNAKTQAMKKMLGGTALGVCHPKNDAYNVSLLGEANIGWVRFDISSAPYVVDADGNAVLDGDNKQIETEGYKAFKARCSIFKEQGIKIMTITPYPDDMLALIGEESVFNSGGEFSANFKKMMREFSAYYATDLVGYVDAIQISNELTIEKWQGALTLQQVCEYLDMQAAAMCEITRANDIPIGYNVAGYNLYKFPSTMQQYIDHFDFVGLDLYLGCFESVYKTTYIYELLLRYLYNMTGLPIMLDEFGYISAGTPMSDSDKATYLAETYGADFATEQQIRNNVSAFLDKFEQIAGEESPLIREARRKLATDGAEAAANYIFADDQVAHLYKSLPEGYELSNYAHTPEGQGAFYADTIKSLSKLDFLCGMFIYMYNDSVECYQCGQEGCPVETGWGLVSLDELAEGESYNATNVHKKPSYLAVQEAYGKIVADWAKHNK